MKETQKGKACQARFPLLSTLKQLLFRSYSMFFLVHFPPPVVYAGFSERFPFSRDSKKKQGLREFLQTPRHIDNQPGGGEPDVGDVGDGDVENRCKRVVTVEQGNAGFELRPARQQGEDEKANHSLGGL